MSEVQCPLPDQLAAFVQCQLSEPVSDQVLSHLEICGHCEATVANLEATLKAVLPLGDGSIPVLPFEEESECQHVVDRLVKEAQQGIGPSAQPSLAESEATFRDFRILSQIGAGGMGAVYKALHQRMQRTVALKVLPANRISDPSSIARFSREMAVLGQLNHPHIVQAFDAGEHDGQHFLVMEYVDGADLASVVREHGPLPVADACLIIAQAASALQYAHEKGIIHRDIKPSNLMLARGETKNGQPGALVKVLDLGLARALDQPLEAAVAKPELTTAGQIMGTIDYMAPEQGTDSHQVDIRADIYALGATLYKLLTGDAPYAEHSHKPPLQRLMAMAQQEPPPIRSKRAEVPPPLAAVVHRMLAKSPEQRFQTPADVVTALQPFCTGADLAHLLLPKETIRQSPPITSPNSRAGSSKRRSWLALGGFASVLLFGVVLVLTTRHGRVEIATPDGQLPDDVKIVVSRNGEDVKVLQVDNHWSAKIVNGEYQVALRGGADRFELKQSQLTVSRLGKAVVTITQRSPEAVVLTPKPPTTPSPNVPVATSLAPASATESPPDRAKPFVVVDAQGIVLREHQFANEALPVLQDGEILEVHGSGPFKVGQITRQNTTLHIRAGQGYRPRFIVGFEIPAAAYKFQSAGVPWFRLDDVKLAIEGCDFVGASCFSFLQFTGTGGIWFFEDCRLIQPSTTQGAILSFLGDDLTVRNSLFSVAGFSGAVASLRGVDLIRFEHNVLMGPIAFGVDAGVPQLVVLKGNTICSGNPLVMSKEKNSGDHPIVEADDNLFVPGFANLFLSLGEAVPLPKPNFSWKGRGNRYLPLRAGFLWQRPVPEGEPASGLATVAEWNEYWKSPDDLTQIESVKFAWDLFDQTDWTAGRQRVAAEIAAARKRFPELAQLGPEIELVGSGTAFDVARKKQDAAKPAALEGGPFVLLRGEQVVASYPSIDSAIQQAQDEDVIEVRGDGPFPAVQTGYAIRRITLRAANGYRPSFAQLGTNDKIGEWTLEGLHFRGVPGAPTLWCQARKLINCSCDPVLGDGRIHVMAVPGAEQPLEIINCYFPAALDLVATKVRVENTVANSIGTTSSEVAYLDISRSFLWAHESTRSTLYVAAIGFNAPADSLIRCTDCLIDAEAITTYSYFQWQGDRNLYRISGQRWPALNPTPDVWKGFNALGEWQQHWNSDQNSREDDSMLFSKELWSNK